MRSIRTGTLILLSLGAGLFAGLLIGRELALNAERKVRIAIHEMMTTPRVEHDPRRDAAQWRADSLRMLRDGELLNPREVGRFQALQNCVVRLSFARGGTELELFHLRAETMPYSHLATGWVYQPDGFPKGSSVDVVLPATRCEHIHRFSYGATRIQPPWTAEPDSMAPAPHDPPPDTGNADPARPGVIPTRG